MLSRFLKMGNQGAALVRSSDDTEIISWILSKD